MRRALLSAVGQVFAHERESRISIDLIRAKSTKFLKRLSSDQFDFVYVDGCSAVMVSGQRLDASDRRSAGVRARGEGKRTRLCARRHYLSDLEVFKDAVQEASEFDIESTQRPIVSHVSLSVDGKLQPIIFISSKVA